MLEVLPNLWARADLVAGWRIEKDRIVVVHYTTEAGFDKRDQQKFKDAAAALRWVEGLDKLYDAYLGLTREDDE